MQQTDNDDELLREIVEEHRRKVRWIEVQEILFYVVLGIAVASVIAIPILIKLIRS